jgi:putative ABC transport system permease protein
MLLIGAGLLVKNFWRLLHANSGVNPANVLTMRLTLTAAKYNDLTQAATFARELDRRVAALPGIESVGLVNHIPLAGSNSSGNFLIEGAPEPPPGQQFSGRFRVCTPDYFRSLGITLKTGRGFTAQDNIGAPRVIIINETLERRHWPNGDAIGKRIRFIGSPEQNPWMQIVGVVNDVNHLLDETVTPEYYLPFDQLPVRSLYVAARTKTDPLALASAIRNEVLAIDKGQPVSELRTMEQVRSQSVTLYSFSSALLGVFAAIALVLASVGIYGVMSYAVTQRTQEIGLRLALGAQASDVLRLVIGRGMKLTLIGVTVGLVASLALTRLMKNLLIGVSPADPLTFIVIPLLLMLVALLACWIPARQATKVDPLVAIRNE